MTTTERNRALSIVLAVCQSVAALAVIFAALVLGVLVRVRHGALLEPGRALRGLALAAVVAVPPLLTSSDALRMTLGQIHAEVRDGRLRTPPWQVLPGALSLIAIFVVMFSASGGH